MDDYFLLLETAFLANYILAFGLSLSVAIYVDYGRFSFRLLFETLDLIEPMKFVTVMDKRSGLCTVPDLLFDYEKNGLPPELENLKPEKFLGEPDKPNLVFLPKKDLARICEMLSPKEFLALSQTCRFLHWRMMKFCHCSVENLEVYIRPEGRRSNGNVIHHVYPKMASNLHRKQLLFHNVHLYYVVPADLNVYLKNVILMFGGRKNIKRLEFTYVEPEMDPPVCLSNGGESLLNLCNFLRTMAPSHLHMEVYDPSDTEGAYYTCGFEVRQLPHLTEGSCAREKEVIVRSRKGFYLCVPPVILDKLLKLFLGPEPQGIQEYICSFPVEHYQEVYSCVEKNWKRALERMGVRMKIQKGDYSETFFFTFPGERYQLVRVREHCVYLLATNVPFGEGDY